MSSETSQFLWGLVIIVIILLAVASNGKTKSEREAKKIMIDYIESKSGPDRRIDCSDPNNKVACAYLDSKYDQFDSSAMDKMYP